MNTLLLGSLPFTDKDKALNFSQGFSYFTLPELIKLPHELMMDKMSSDHLTVYSKQEIVDAELFIHMAGPMCIKTYLGLSADVIFKKVKAYEDYFYDKKLHFIFDEPVMNKEVDLVSFYKNLADKSIGVHSCCRIEFECFKDLKLSYFSFDHFLNSDQVSKFKTISSSLIFGVISPKGEVDPNFDVQTLSSQDFISPTCGLGMLSPETCSSIKNQLLSL